MEKLHGILKLFNKGIRKLGPCCWKHERISNSSFFGNQVDSKWLKKSSSFPEEFSFGIPIGKGEAVYEDFLNNDLIVKRDAHSCQLTNSSAEIREKNLVCNSLLCR